MLRMLVAPWLAALVASAPAFGATPALSVGVSASPQGGSTTIGLTLTSQTAALAVYVPPGYGARLVSGEGARVGDVRRAVAVVAGEDVDLEGSLRAVDPASTAGDPCAPGAHTAVWRLDLAGSGARISTHLFVDSANGPESAYAAYKLQACLPSEPGGPRLVELELRLDDVFASPSTPGRYVWRALFTPGAADGSGPMPAAAVEARSTALLPLRLDLHGSYRLASGKAGLTGSLHAGGEPVAGQRVTLWSGPGAWPRLHAGAATTRAGGGFRAVREIRTTTFVRASAVVPARPDPAGCPGSIALSGCVAAELARLSVESEAVRIVVPPQPTLRLGSRGAAVQRLQRELVRLRYLPAGRAGHTYGESTWHAVVALQGWLRLPRTGVVDRRTWAALWGASVPRPWGGMRHGVEIDTARQVLLLIENGRVARALHVSTGAGGRTPLGRFGVYRKEQLSWSVPFGVWMPYASYFHGGFAMHEYPSVPSYPASHGCVRVPAADAPSVYAFAGYGTPVWIR
jgi:hypothetical protein